MASDAFLNLRCFGFVLDKLSYKGNPVFDCRPNEKLILDILRQSGKASKAQIARMTELTAVAVGSLIKSLNEKGLVEPVGKVQGDMGQPATLYAISGEGAYSFGISINRGQFELVLMNLLGEVIASRKHESLLSSPETVVQAVSKDLEGILEEVDVGVRRKVLGVGVARPSNIRSQQKHNERWQAWANFDVSQNVSSVFGLPVISQNDVNAAAMAEYIYGSVSKSESFLYLFFGGAMIASLGSAIFLNGQCWSGVNGNAGDIGLGPVGTRSSQPLFFDRCSLHSLVVCYGDQGYAIKDHRELMDLVEREPAVFESWSDDWVTNFAQFLNRTQALLDLPEFIVDGDDIVESLVNRLLHKVEQRMPDLVLDGLFAPKITLGSFAGQAAAIGAASLPINAAFNPRAQVLPGLST